MSDEDAGSLGVERSRSLAKRELDAHRQYRRAVVAAGRTLTTKLDAIKAELAKLDRYENDPEVLVRNGPGPAVEIFHAAGDYCRRVTAAAVARGRYDRMFLGEALERGLRPCSACAEHLVRRRRLRPA